MHLWQDNMPLWKDCHHSVEELCVSKFSTRGFTAKPICPLLAVWKVKRDLLGRTEEL